MKEDLKGIGVGMSLDGWSNIRNESIICVCVTEAEEKMVHRIDTIDTEGNSHTGEYLLLLAVTAVEKCNSFKYIQNSFGCTVRSFVTDNAGDMGKMRRELSEKMERTSLLTDVLHIYSISLLMTLKRQQLKKKFKK